MVGIGRLVCEGTWVSGVTLEVGDGDVNRLEGISYCVSCVVRVSLLNVCVSISWPRSRVFGYSLKKWIGEELVVCFVSTTGEEVVALWLKSVGSVVDWDSCAYSVGGGVFSVHSFSVCGTVCMVPFASAGVVSVFFLSCCCVV